MHVMNFILHCCLNNCQVTFTLLLMIFVADIDHCESNACLNGGSCDNRPGDGYDCTCPPGYTGTHCETGRSLNACVGNEP